MEVYGFAAFFLGLPNNSKEAFLENHSAVVEALSPHACAYLVALAVRTELGLLLSDAMAPEAAVPRQGDTPLQGRGSSWGEGGTTAGQRAAADLGFAFAVLGALVDLLSHGKKPIPSLPSLPLPSPPFPSLPFLLFPSVSFPLFHWCVVLV